MIVQIRQVRSTIKAPKNQKLNMIALGLGKIGRIKEVEYTDVIKGQVRKVSHLVTVTEIAATV